MTLSKAWALVDERIDVVRNIADCAIDGFGKFRYQWAMCSKV